MIAGPLVAFAIGLTWPRATALADEPYIPKLVPACAVYEGEEATLCCYESVDEVVALYNADADCVAKKTQAELLAQKVNLLEVKTEGLARQLELSEDAKGKALERTRKLTAELVALDKAYQEERAKPVLGSWVPWTVAAVALGALAGSWLL